MEVSGLSADLILIDDALLVLTRPYGAVGRHQLLPQYDFPFHSFFRCSHPYRIPENACAVARIGAVVEYTAMYEELLGKGVRLINSPAEYDRASELTCWYPLLREMTPRSTWFDHFPSVKEVEKEFSWPVFMKGSRQTSHHRSHLAIMRSPDDLERARDEWCHDSILKWQKVVCREYIPLRLVGESEPGEIPRAFEFRTFWYKGQLAAWGPYRVDVPYVMAREDEPRALALAREAARRVSVPFVVVDIAQTAKGDWIVIECNDGQESGMVGVLPFQLWRNMVDIEQSGFAQG